VLRRYIDFGHPGENPFDEEPLRPGYLYHQLCLILRKRPERYESTDHCWDILASLLLSCEWFEFYDAVEQIGEELQEVESRPVGDDYRESYGYGTYARAVNALLAEENVGWRLDGHGDLVRQTPAAVQRPLDRAAEDLSDFAAARQHFIKARRFVHHHPIDAENGIKEIVSALESVGKTLYPGTATLGDVVKAMRSEKALPPQLIAMIERFYAYASSEPAVRHGASVPSRVLLADAEFALHVGTATIRYLLARRSEGSTEER